MQHEEEDYIDLNKLTVRELLVKTYEKVLSLEREMELRRKWKDDVNIEIARLKVEMETKIRTNSLMWAVMSSLATGVLIEAVTYFLKTSIK